MLGSPPSGGGVEWMASLPLGAFETSMGERGRSGRRNGRDRERSKGPFINDVASWFLDHSPLTTIGADLKY